MQNTEDVMPPRIEMAMSRGQLTRALNRSHRHVADLLEAGVVAPVVPGKGRRPAVFDALVAIPAALRHERQKTRPGESARDRRDASQAALNELKLSRETGELVSRPEVVRAGRTIVFAARDRLLRLGHDLVQRGAIAAPHAAAVDDVVREALTELSRLGQEPTKNHPERRTRA